MVRFVLDSQPLRCNFKSLLHFLVFPETPRFLKREPARGICGPFPGTLAFQGTKLGERNSGSTFPLFCESAVFLFSPGGPKGSALQALGEESG